jgi:Methyltransferase domain
LFVERARSRAETIPNLTFVHGDGREVPFSAGSFDAVVCHTALCHIPEPERVLDEAYRVTVPDGMLAIFHGDYETRTVALCDHDPLQACAAAAMAALVRDPRLVRRLPALVREAEYEIVRLRSHGYAETDEPSYMLTIIDRGADALLVQRPARRRRGRGTRAEARRRADAGTFFGHIAYASLIARRAQPSVVVCDRDTPADPLLLVELRLRFVVPERVAGRISRRRRTGLHAAKLGRPADSSAFRAERVSCRSRRDARRSTEAGRCCSQQSAAQPSTWKWSVLRSWLAEDAEAGRRD